eukprot:CAMPEP_0201640066 /NCGR_PEP_ID=MMETSP0493-20130528/20982_1 /ASSEMBLY_ACC=CAM_ASM_000838 /TAXON_ID=420259 /ORGANISM="Thalassiosira gravida, Strain GMp14c1" /LENGTH=36 /DNA_ID= /DNA_START= /DNA_END= /DNA_ORIENTATION=
MIGELNPDDGVGAGLIIITGCAVGALERPHMLGKNA